MNPEKKGGKRVNPLQKKKRQKITTLSLTVAAAAILMTSVFAAGSSFPNGGDIRGGVAMAQTFGNQTFDTGQSTTNTAISPPSWTGSIVTFPVVSSALLSQVQFGLMEATQTAVGDVGEGSYPVEAALRTQGGYLVWVVSVIDTATDYTLHRVIVDPMTGEVLDNVPLPNARFGAGVSQQQGGNQTDFTGGDFGIPPTLMGNQSFPTGPAEP